MPRRRPRAGSSEDESPRLTRDFILMDAYARLTSRKLLMCLVSVGLSIWSYHAGIITGTAMVTAISAAVGTYIAAEGLNDFAANWGSEREKARMGREEATARAMEARVDMRAMEQANGGRRQSVLPVDVGAPTRGGDWEG